MEFIFIFCPSLTSVHTFTILLSKIFKVVISWLDNPDSQYAVLPTSGLKNHITNLIITDYITNILLIRDHISHFFFTSDEIRLFQFNTMLLTSWQTHCENDGQLLSRLYMMEEAQYNPKTYRNVQQRMLASTWMNSL